MIRSLSHGSLRHHDQLCSGIWRRELMFYLERSSPNEPQAEVRNGASIALLSDYRSETSARAYSSSGLFWCARAPLPHNSVGKYHLLAPQRHTRGERAASVMSSSKSKSDGPQHCAQKGQKWGGKEGWRRQNEMLAQMSSDRLVISDTLFPRLTLVLQLVLGPTLHRLPWCFFVVARTGDVHVHARNKILLNSSPSVCKYWLQFSFSLCKCCLFGRCLVCVSVCHGASVTAEIRFTTDFNREMRGDDEQRRF